MSDVLHNATCRLHTGFDRRSHMCRRCILGVEIGWNSPFQQKVAQPKLRSFIKPSGNQSGGRSPQSYNLNLTRNSLMCSYWWRSGNQPIFLVFAAVVSDPELSSQVYNHHILRPHRELRAGWIRTGLSGTEMFAALLVPVCHSYLHTRYVSSVALAKHCTNKCQYMDGFNRWTLWNF